MGEGRGHEELQTKKRRMQNEKKNEMNELGEKGRPRKKRRKRRKGKQIVDKLPPPLRRRLAAFYATDASQFLAQNLGQAKDSP